MGAQLAAFGEGEDDRPLGFGVPCLRCQRAAVSEEAGGAGRITHTADCSRASAAVCEWLADLARLKINKHDPEAFLRIAEKYHRAASLEDARGAA